MLSGDDKADVPITGDFNIDLVQINERTEIQNIFICLLPAVYFLELRFPLAWPQKMLL